MTIDQLFTTEIQYVGDGVQATFPVPFPFFEAADVRVVLRDGEIDTPLYHGADFTVQAAEPLGGEVRLAQAPAAGVAVFVFLDIPATQLLNLHNQGRLPAEELEKALDKLTMILAQLNARVARALLIPLGTGNPDEWFANYDGWITATLENAQNTAGMAQQVLDQAETALGSAGGAQAQAEQALSTAIAAIDTVNTAAGEVVAAKNAAESAALEASAIFSKLLGLRVVVVFLTGGATPSGSYDPDTGVLTIRIFVPTEGGGGGSDVTVSDSLNGTGTAAEGVAASEWALAQVNTKATGAQGAAAAAQGAAAAAQTEADAAFTAAQVAQSTATAAQGAADAAYALAEGASGAGGLPLLSVFWSTTGLPEDGYLNLSLDNGQIPYDAFPSQVWEKINLAHTENTGAVITEAAWLAEVALHGTCGRYALGEDFFRVPLLRKRASFGFPDAAAGAGHGDFLEDQMRSITGTIRKDGGQTGAVATTDILSGALEFTGSSYGSANINQYSGRQGRDLGLNSGLLGPHYSGDITHSPLIIYTPMLKMYGAIDDPGLLNAAATVQMIAGKLDTAAYEADAPMRIKAWVRTDASGTIAFATPGIVSCTRTGTGLYTYALAPGLLQDSRIGCAGTLHDAAYIGIMSIGATTTSQINVRTFVYSSAARDFDHTLVILGA